jgi:cell division protein FtsN
VSPAETPTAPESALDKPGAAPPASRDEPGLARAPEPATPAARPSAVAAREPAPAARAARFAVEIGPFVMPAEAERVERQLHEAGYQTARLRRQTDAAVYAVLVEKIPTVREAQTLVADLRDEGFDNVAVLGESEPLTVRVGTPLPLRGAVQVAERLRAGGHHVRVSAQPGTAVTFVIRHGSFTTVEEAEAKSQELAHLGVASQAVRVK